MNWKSYWKYFYLGTKESIPLHGVYRLFPTLEQFPNFKLRRGTAVNVISSGSEEREFEPHSGSDEVILFPPSVDHHYGDSYDGGSYQSIGLSA